MSSFTKVIRMICVILSFEIASYFSGLSLTKLALRFLSRCHMGIILVKKSAFNNSSYNRFKLSLRIRL